MLGAYVLGLAPGLPAMAFAALTAVLLTVAYSFIGATWLIFKAEGALQRKAVAWARGGIWGMVGGLAAVSVVSPLASERVFDKWFSFPEIVLLAPMPLGFALVSALLVLALRHLPTRDDSWAWFPFAATVALFVLAFVGLAYSFLPLRGPRPADDLRRRRGIREPDHHPRGGAASCCR